MIREAATVDALGRLARSSTGLEFLLLFGSRARGDGHALSDWDLGYQGTPAFDAAALLAAIVETLGSDRIDLVDLSRANGLLRYRAARDGQTICEARAGLVESFRLDAVRFWCDVAPILQRGYDEVLAELPR